MHVVVACLFNRRDSVSIGMLKVGFFDRTGVTRDGESATGTLKDTTLCLGASTVLGDAAGTYIDGDPTFVVAWRVGGNTGLCSIC